MSSQFLLTSVLFYFSGDTNNVDFERRSNSWAAFFKCRTQLSSPSFRTRYETVKKEKQSTVAISNLIVDLTVVKWENLRWSCLLWTLNSHEKHFFASLRTFKACLETEHQSFSSEFFSQIFVFFQNSLRHNRAEKVEHSHFRSSQETLKTLKKVNVAHNNVSSVN
jgi:hypothetical protein